MITPLHDQSQEPVTFATAEGATVSQPNRPRVVVFGLGGTIAMTQTTNGGVAPALSTDDLVAAVPGLNTVDAAVEVVDFRRVPGASLTFDDLLDLNRAIADAFADGARGVVVTQGTDTIEETAFLLDLYHADPGPVIVTGAMRNPTMAGADGPANLLAAVTTAASDRATGMGVLVAFADEIHTARQVRKTHTTSIATFQSPNGGPVGHVVEGQLRLLHRPDPRFVVPAPTRPMPRVGLVTITIGDQGELLDGASDCLDGLVIAAMGAGHVPDRLVPTLQALAERMPVVLASRTGAGHVLTSTYGFPGSERDLIERGLIPAGLLHPLKARLLLAATIAAGADQDTITAAFSAIGGTADPYTWPWPFSAGTTSQEAAADA